MATTASYDDGEDVPTPDDGWEPQHRPVLEAIRAIPDEHTRRAVMAVFVLAVLHGRVGRE
jgi:hypothetical protein